MIVDADKELNILQCGTAVITRRLLESDREKILDGFEALSELSRYRRFLHNKHQLEQSEIECLFSLPQRRGVSYTVLECEDTTRLSEGRCIGLIQLIELESVRAGAEIALVVIDEFHHCGAGKLLLKIIGDEAGKRKIRDLYFYTTADNQALKAILKKSGWDIGVDRDCGSVTYVAHLARRPAVEPVCQPPARQCPAKPGAAGLVITVQKLSLAWFRLYLKLIIVLNKSCLLFSGSGGIAESRTRD